MIDDASPTTPSLGLVYPSGRMRIEREDVRRRVQCLEAAGFAIREFEPATPSVDGFSSGSDMDRAMLFCQALTLRAVPTLWAARGGYGSSAMLPRLESLLPPVIPDKTLVGYSDVSFIGNVLANRYPNFRYIMAGNALEAEFHKALSEPTTCEKQLASDYELTLALVKGQMPGPKVFRSPAIRGKNLSGPMLPINLSLAESMACLKNRTWPKGAILFTEDINEDLYRVLRKIDSLKLAGLLQSCQAIVLGDFGRCLDDRNQPVAPNTLAQLISDRTTLPVCLLPVFGHGERRFPIVAGAPAHIRHIEPGTCEITIHFGQATHEPTGVVSRRNTPQHTEPESSLQLGAHDPVQTRVHFLGIGGTGMAAVAGLAKHAGYTITGSDGPIYPPMSETIAELGLKPFEGYRAENLREAAPDVIVLANAISRISGNLQRNEEFEALIHTQLPVFSFPGFLHHAFLSKTNNIVVSGTHGKTTTTSFISYALRELGLDPSFLIGGAPQNFSHGFHLGQSPIFVLEGDEYDTALFDKGPKFLHYNPKITVMNNIEFDHADIYSDLAAIRQEFWRLAQLTQANEGLLVANLGDRIVRDIAETSSCLCIGYAAQFQMETGATQGALDSKTPLWLYLGHETLASGSRIHIKTPGLRSLSFTTKLFGSHNALNAVATLATLHAYHLIQEANFSSQRISLFEAAQHLPEGLLTRWFAAIQGFLGVRRRFELISQTQDIAIFDDFAHHPTAIHQTLQAFRDYHAATKRNGKLRVCFDPRNATMRRNVLQKELTESLTNADHMYIGKVATDLRIPESERMCSKSIERDLRSKGYPAEAFDDSESLLERVYCDAKAGDTVVFMSSGAFDNLPRKLASLISQGNKRAK